MLVYIGEF